MAEKLKILVVDDNKDVTDIISRILSRENFQVIQLNKPEKIEEMILGEDFNLVITDLMMPEVDGFEVLKIIKSAKPDIPVVVLTGHGTIQKAVEATKRGAADFLSKPISKDDLIQVAKKYVSLKEELPPDIMGLMEDEDSFGRAPDQAMPEKFLLPTEIVSTATTPPGFVEINFQDIVPGQFLSFPLYLQILNRKTQKLFLRKILNRNTVLTLSLIHI